MIKWTVEYTDYNDNPVKEDLYFHLNKAELMEMNLNANGAYSEFINRITNSRDYKALGEEFKKLILSGYGVKSDDGRTFKKSPEMVQAFEQSEAYATLYMELVSDADALAKFIRGMVPKDLQGAIPTESGMALA